MSNTGTNDDAGRMFFRDYWRPYMDIGKPFRDMERHLWSLYHQKHGWWRWVLSYNLYGDPKFGPTPGSFAAAEALTTEGDADDVPPGLSVDIPLYEVTPVDGIDHVEIPGGKVLSDPGQYLVPYWSEEVMVPAGYQVQDVTATRTGFTADTGLQLPLSPDDFMESDSGEPFIPQEYEWFPDVPFRWNVIPNDDGSQTLVLMVYPFSYNSSTTDSHFYSHYEFSFSSVSTAVEISNVHLDRTEIRPGEEIEGFVEFHNTSTESLTVRFSAMVESYGGEQYTDGLPLQSLQLQPGYSSVVFSWESAGIAEGHYKLNAAIEDDSGNKLDTAAAHFSIDSEAVCFGDFDADGDFDGIDLGEFVTSGNFDKLAEFADVFGSFCP